MPVRNDASWLVNLDICVLRDINTAPVGSRHCPVNHGDAVDLFEDALRLRNLVPTVRISMLHPDLKRFIYTVEFRTQDDGMRFILGFINYNDGTKSFTGIAGERIMVCSNQMFTGIIQESKRRHTTNIMEDIRACIDTTVGYFPKFVETRREEIQYAKTHCINLAGAVLYMHRHTSIASATIGQCIKEFDNPSFDYNCDKGSKWAFQNACTHVFKKFNPLYRIDMQKELQKCLLLS